MGEIHSSHTPPRLPQQPQQKLLPMQPIPQQQALLRTGKTLEEILLWETLTQGKYLIECFFWLHLVRIHIIHRIMAIKQKIHQHFSYIEYMF